MATPVVKKKPVKKRTNETLECNICEHEMYSKDYFSHLKRVHFTELFLSTEKEHAVQVKENLKGLQRADAPLKLFASGNLYCCLSCDKAIKAQNSCRLHHFDVTAPERNHCKAHKIECKKLYEEILAIKKAQEEEDSGVSTEAPESADEPSEVVEKPVVIKVKPVEKVAFTSNKDTDYKEPLTELLCSFNIKFINAEVSDKMVEKLTADLIECKRLVDLKDSIIKRLEFICKTGSEYKSEKMADWIEDANVRTMANQTSVQENLVEYRRFVQSKVDTSTVWSEFSTELKDLGVYDDVMDYLS